VWILLRGRRRRSVRGRARDMYLLILELRGCCWVTHELTPFLKMLFILG
jgi:hypothetical protein